MHLPVSKYLKVCINQGWLEVQIQHFRANSKPIFVNDHLGSDSNSNLASPEKYGDIWPHRVSHKPIVSDSHPEIGEWDVVEIGVLRVDEIRIRTPNLVDNLLLSNSDRLRVIVWESKIAIWCSFSFAPKLPNIKPTHFELQIDRILHQFAVEVSQI